MVKHRSHFVRSLDVGKTRGFGPLRGKVGTGQSDEAVWIPLSNATRLRPVEWHGGQWVGSFADCLRVDFGTSIRVRRIRRLIRHALTANADMGVKWRQPIAQ